MSDPEVGTACTAHPRVVCIAICVSSRLLIRDPIVVCACQTLPAVSKSVLSVVSVRYGEKQKRI